MLWLFATVLVSAPLPGQLNFSAGPGLVIRQDLKLQIGGGGEWYPFSATSGGGLDHIGCEAYASVDLASTGIASLLIGSGYGRPGPGLWANFQALAAVVVGWHAAESGARATVSPVGSLRVGYGPVAMRLLAYVSSSLHVMDDDYYRLSVEYLW